MSKIQVNISEEDYKEVTLKMLIACCAQQQAILKALAKFTGNNEAETLGIVTAALDIARPQLSSYEALQTRTVDMLIEVITGLTVCTDLIIKAISKSDEEAAQLISDANACREQRVNEVVEVIYAKWGIVDLNAILNT